MPNYYIIAILEFLIKQYVVFLLKILNQKKNEKINTDVCFCFGIFNT